MGVGGIGSSVAVQLARIGIYNIKLIDHDVFEKSNINRLYGSKLGDVGKPKVDIVKSHLKSFSQAKIDAMQDNVCKGHNLDALMDSDVIICCTDNLQSRQYLNDISLKIFQASDRCRLQRYYR